MRTGSLMLRPYRRFRATILPMACAFIGLGVMGFPMAGHLAAAGQEVTVFNRTVARADAWVAAHGGAAASTPAEAADGADFVFLCVGDDPDVRVVTTGPGGVLETMASGDGAGRPHDGVGRCRP